MSVLWSDLRLAVLVLMKMPVVVGMILLVSGIGQASQQEWLRQVSLAKQQELKGEYQAAYESLREALPVASRLGPQELAITMNNAGSLAQDLGHYLEAENHYRQSIAQWEAAGDSGEKLTRPLQNLATLYARTRRYAIAEQTYDRVLAIRIRTVGPRHPDVGRVLNNYGLAKHFQGKLADAEQLYRDALEILREANATAGVDLGNVQTNLAALFMHRGLYREAATMAAEGVASFEQSVGAEHPALIPALTWLGKAALKMGTHAKAAESLERAMCLARRTLGDEHPTLAPTLTAKTELLRSQQRKGEAKRLQQQADKIVANHQRRNLLDHTVDLHSLRSTYEE